MNTTSFSCTKAYHGSLYQLLYEQELDFEI